VTGAVLVTSRNLKFRLGKPLLLMVLASLSWAGFSVATKYLLDFADFWTVFSYTKIGAAFALIPLLCFGFSDLASTVKEHGKKVVGAMSLNEILYALGILFITIATSVGYVTLVSALASLQPFFLLLFAVALSIFYPKILKEEIGKSAVLLKLLAIALMFTGAILII
jgi:drug/metabolite transporter (DMT)-like permease